MLYRLASLFGLFVNGGLVALAVGTVVPGTHRVIYPETAGLTEVSPRVWTDAPARASELRGLANSARSTVRGFFGDEPPKPTLVLCTTRKCARAFGIGGNGLSMADLAVMVSPGGLRLGTLTHEMTHSRLHKNMGIRNIFRQPFPTWFDEGLATHVAGHPVPRGTSAARAERRRIRQVTRFWKWDDAYREIGVAKAYGAAAAEVATIERSIGRQGLLELIRRADAGEEFMSVLEELSQR